MIDKKKKEPLENKNLLRVAMLGLALILIVSSYYIYIQERNDTSKVNCFNGSVEYINMSEARENGYYVVCGGIINLIQPDNLKYNIKLE